MFRTYRPALDGLLLARDRASFSDVFQCCLDLSLGAGRESGVQHVDDGESGQEVDIFTNNMLLKLLDQVLSNQVFGPSRGLGGRHRWGCHPGRRRRCGDCTHSRVCGRALGLPILG
jgi:hypothetical protein